VRGSVPHGCDLFGKRRDLIEEARKGSTRARTGTTRTVYGEHGGRGTGYMYLSAVPFEKIAFRTDLGTKHYPELTSGFLSAVPLVDILWPASCSASTT